MSDLRIGLDCEKYDPIISALAIHLLTEEPSSTGRTYVWCALSQYYDYFSINAIAETLCDVICACRASEQRHDPAILAHVASHIADAQDSFLIRLCACLSMQFRAALIDCGVLATNADAFKGIVQLQKRIAEHVDPVLMLRKLRL